MIRIVLWLVICALCLSGCIHSYYAANSHNVPMLTDKKDTRASLNYYLGSRESITFIPGLELQGSFALGRHIGVMGSFLTMGKARNDIYVHARYGDLGLGYYWTDPSKKLVLETYVAYGLGYAENGFEGDAFSSSDFTKLFIQPSVGFKSRFFDMSFSWRYGQVHHSSIGPGGTLPEYAIMEFEYILQNRSYSVSEPALTFRFGDQNLKAQIQTGWSSSASFHNSRFWTSVGLFITFPFKKEN